MSTFTYNITTNGVTVPIQIPLSTIMSHRITNVTPIFTMDTNEDEEPMSYKEFLESNKVKSYMNDNDIEGLKSFIAENGINIGHLEEYVRKTKLVKFASLNIAGIYITLASLWAMLYVQFQWYYVSPITWICCIVIWLIFGRDFILLAKLEQMIENEQQSV